METRRFITAFTSALQLSLSWARSTQSMPSHPTSWRIILIWSSHLRLGLPSGLFPSGFPTKTMYTTRLSPIRVTCPACLILLYLITRTMLGEEYTINPLNAKLNLICHLLALLGAHHILHVSRIRVKLLVVSWYTFYTCFSLHINTFKTVLIVQLTFINSHYWKKSNP